MEKKSLLLLCFAIATGSCAQLQAMKFLKLVFKKNDPNKKLRKSMQKRDNEEICEILKKNKKIWITQKLLKETTKQGSKKKVVFIGDNIEWNSPDRFDGYDDKTAREIIEKMDKNTVLSQETMKAIICSNRPKIFELFLGRYLDFDGDITKRIAFYKPGYLKAGSYGYEDFIIAALGRAETKVISEGVETKVLSEKCAIAMLKLLFENGIWSTEKHLNRDFSDSEREFYEKLYKKDSFFRDFLKKEVTKKSAELTKESGQHIKG